MDTKITVLTVISIVVAIAGFGLIIFGISRIFKDSCPSDMTYDDENKECREICTDGAKWYPEVRKCLPCPPNYTPAPNCPDGCREICNNEQTACDCTCILPSQQTCIDRKPCLIAKSCGKPKETRIQGVFEVSPSPSPYHGETCCGDGEKCDPDSGKCIKCGANDVVCKGVCCGEHQSCSKDGACCDTDKICKDGTCCSTTACQAPNSALTCGGCCGNKCCPPDQFCEEGTCKTPCGGGGGQPRKFCDPDTQTCETATKNGTQGAWCITKGCEWGTLTYDPENQKAGDDVINTCGAGTRVVSCRNSELTGPFTKQAISSQDASSTRDCTLDDCYFRTADEKGVDNVKFDGKTCTASFDCQKYLDTCGNCPYGPETGDQGACCENPTGGFTGQICPPGQICLNGNCIYGWQCVTHSASEKDCEVVTTKPGPTVSVYTSLGECQKDCQVLYHCNIDGGCDPADTGDPLSVCQANCQAPSFTCECHCDPQEPDSCHVTSNDCGSRSPVCSIYSDCHCG